MDALHPVQFDVAGRRRSADPGQRTGRVEPFEGLRHRVHHLLGHTYDADVVVGYEGDPAPPLSRTRVEDDRPGLGDGHRAAGDDAVHRVEFASRHARRIRYPLHAVRHCRREPVHGQVLGRHHRAGITPGEQPRDESGQFAAGAVVHQRPVVRQVLGQERSCPGGRPFAVDAQIVARHRDVLRQLVAGDVRQRPADPAQNHVPAAHELLLSPRVRAHQSRKDSGGASGRSRESVQALPGPGSRLGCILRVRDRAR